MSLHMFDNYLRCSNQNLNYYKFGLGLGVPTGALEKRNVPEGKKGEAADAAAGGADQYVRNEVALLIDRLITTDLARFCDTLAAL